jgi:hypothetical protein
MPNRFAKQFGLDLEQSGKPLNLNGTRGFQKYLGCRIFFRQKEAMQQFDAGFIEAARTVYCENDNGPIS